MISYDSIEMQMKTFDNIVLMEDILWRSVYLAPAAFAAWMTDRPRAPRPKTATEVPGSTFVLLNTAPHPVETPQPRRHILLRSAPGLILVADRPWTLKNENHHSQYKLKCGN